MGFSSDSENCGRLVKFGLYGTNAGAFGFGVAMIAVAAWSLAKHVINVSDVAGTNILKGTCYVVLISGICFTVLSFVGFYGTLREIKCMLFTYFLLVSLLFVCLTIAGVLAFVFRETFLDTLDREMKTSMRLYDQRKDIHEAWDTVQSELHCCGVRSYREWGNIGRRLPDSCCKEAGAGRRYNCNQHNEPNPSTTYEYGCMDNTEGFLTHHSALLGVFGILGGLLMFSTMALSYSLFKLIE